MYREDKEFTLRLEQIIEKANMQRYVIVNNESRNDLSDMERLTNLLNTSNCYRQVTKEHLKSMYNQLKYLTTAELQKRNSKLNKQIVWKIIYYIIMPFKMKYCFRWFCLQNDLSTERITLTQLLVDFIDKKKINQKYLIQKLEAQQFEFVSF